ncbi:hypothetical protein [Streptomyces sp. IMTB 2501]|uniref:hypothetical protein n=1 Tax=Streptomyces sp. IMTB 2501 TaxID=1776340 RepID=UPI0015BAE547|nr:hypothetical protein [Streptomyces sp. IMTB 2501]
MSRGLGRVQRAVLAYVLSEPGGRSNVDGTPLAASVTRPRLRHLRHFRAACTGRCRTT